MSDLSTIPRGADYKPGSFHGLKRSEIVISGTTAAPGTACDLWLGRLGLVVHHSKSKVRILTVGEVGLAAVELAKDNPDLRRALIEALTAQGQGVADG